MTDFLKCIGGYLVELPTRTLFIVKKLSRTKIELKGNPKIYGQEKYQLQEERAEAMQKLVMESAELGRIQFPDSEWASGDFMVPKKEKGEWRLVFGYRESTNKPSMNQ